MTVKKLFGIKGISMIGLLAALVFAGSWLQIPIPTMIENSRLHLGNVMCLLSGFLLGPLGGGLAAGLGSMLFDFTNPLYINEAWITFLTKFAMAWLCGAIAWSGGAEAKHLRRNIIAAAAGALFYVVLYLTKTFIMNYVLQRMELTPVLITLAQKGIISTVNGILAAIISVPLNTALRAALERSHLLYAHESQG